MTIEHSPIEEAFHAFMLEGEARRFTPRTLEHYTQRVGAFVSFCQDNGLSDLHDITPTHCRQFMVSLHHLASNTQHAYYRALRAWLNFCVREELIDLSPLRKVKAPKLEKKILPALSIDDATALLAACQSAREKSALLFLLDTGVRASEFCALNGNDIDLKAGVVMIHQGKGRKDRTVYLGAKATRQIMRYYRQRKAPAADAPVWIGERGQNRLTRSGLVQLLRRIGQRAEIHVTAHMCRRTYALWSLRAGVNIYVLARMMGHEDITILRRYLDIVEADAQQASSRFGAVDNFL